MIEELASTRVDALMRRDPIAVPPDTLLADVLALMKDRYGAILVLDASKLIGIFTERDLMLRVNQTDRSAYRRPVSEVMTTNPKTLLPSATIEEALALMTRRVFRHVPIVERDGHVLGMLSVRAILRYAVGHFPADFINLPPGPKSEASGQWGG
jgi:CBS domain-containing protein